MAWAFGPTRANQPPDGACLGADGIDDGTLITRHLAGDRMVFEVLYRRHATPLFRTALAMTRNRPVAEELLQETFLRAYRHLGNVRLSDGATLRPWLHRILVNLIYDDWARRQPHAGPLESGVERMAANGSASPERRAEEGELVTAVEDALAGLPFKQRMVAALFYLQDMEVEEIADVLGVPEGTVKSRLYYGRARLRKMLAADVRVTFDAVPRTARA